jgi:hypothetical protein
MEAEGVDQPGQYERVVANDGTVTLTCLICEARPNFNTDQAYQRHWDSHHGQNGLQFNDQSYFKACGGCRRLFRGERGLEVHSGRCQVVADQGNDQQAENNQNGNGDENEAMEQAAAAAVSERAQMLSSLLDNLEQQKKMRGMLKEATYHVNHNWVKPYHSITTKMLQGMKDADERTVLASTLAFKILPGLLRSTGRLKLGRPIDLLKRIDASENAVEETLIEALRTMRAIECNNVRYPQPQGAASGLLKAAENMGDRARLSAADRFLQQAQSVLTGSAEEAANQQPLPTSDATRVLEGLFPKKGPRNREDLDGLPAMDTAPPGLVITGEDVRSGLKHVSMNAAPGASGWTNHLLRLLGTHGDEHQQTAFAGAIAEVFNKVYAGTMPSTCKWLWTDSRAVLLPKPRGGHRPLGIGDVWYRLMVKIAYGKHTTQIGEALAPEGQLAVGVPGGCEIGARIAQLHMRQENPCPADWEFQPAILSVDVANCFNECPVACAYRELLTLAPALARLFIWTHDAPSDLVYGDGTVVGYREIGEKQGCPGSSANGSLALRPVYNRLIEVVREVERDFIRDKGLTEEEFRQRSLALSYVDDCNLLTCLGVAVRVARLIPAIFAEFGLRVVASKCAILSERVEEAYAAGMWPEDWCRMSDGIKILGAPIGTDAYIKEHFISLGEKIKNPPIEALKRVNRRLALHLATLVHNAEYDYLLRVIEPHLTEDFTEVLDKKIDAELALVADMRVEDMSEQTRTLRGLPVGLGGMGIYRHRARREAGVVNSRARTLSFVKTHCAALTTTAERLDVWPEVAVGASDDIPDAFQNLTAEEQQHLTDGDDPKKVAAAARKMVRHVDEKLQQSIINELLVGNTLRGKNTVAYHRSCMSKSSGSWIRSTTTFGTGITGGRVFPDAVCTQAVRARLLLPMRNAAGRVIVHCPCCFNPQSTSLEGKDIGPSHALGCRYFSNHASFTARHNDARDKLAAALQHHLRYAEPVVEKEVPLSHLIPGHAGQEVIDIVVRAAGGQYVRYIDVAVTEPSCSSAVELGSWEEPLRAAARREADKASWYASRAPAVDQSLIIPFVLESSGRAGQRAKQFLADALPGPVVSRVLRDISLALNHFGGQQMVALSRGRAG